MENFQKNIALDILEKKLNDEAIEEFLSISNDMETLFKEHAELSMSKAREIIESFFYGRGESEAFVEKWIKRASEHCKKYGIVEDAMPKALVADLGMFRFMTFFEENGLSHEEVFQIFAGAADQTSDVEFKVPGTMKMPEKGDHDCSCQHNGGCDHNHDHNSTDQ
jgi:hypothetical protein